MTWKKLLLAHPPPLATANIPVTNLHITHITWYVLNYQYVGHSVNVSKCGTPKWNGWRPSQERSKRYSESDVHVTVHRVIFLTIKPTRCTNFSNLFWNETLDVLDSSSVHHQKFFTVHTAMIYVTQVCWQLASRISMELVFLKFILGMKFYMFRTVPLSIIRSFSLYTQQWYMSYRFADSLRAGSGWNWTSSILILLARCLQTCMTYTIAVCTVKNSWWWTEELSVTCRVSFQE